MKIDKPVVKETKNIKQSLAEITSKNMADIKKAQAEKEKTDGRQDIFTRSDEDKKGLFDSSYIDSLIKHIESADENAKSSSKSISAISTCMRIARRIMNGDKVPIKDHRFLQENCPDMYRQALLFRKVNPKPKEYKSLVEDEEEDNAREDQGENSRSPESVSADTVQSSSPTAQTETTE